MDCEFLFNHLISSMAKSTILYTHPLYLSPSNTPCVVLIPVKLTGPKNYSLWNKIMKIALLGKWKLGFVTGTCTNESCTVELYEIVGYL